jgi:hypothetical protein
MIINSIKISAFIVIIFCTGCATSGGDRNTAESVDNSPTTVGQAAQAGKQAIESGTSGAAKSIEVGQTGLTNSLVNQLGVSQQQALGGAGAIFQVAKENMDPQAFAALSQSIPGMNNMLSAAPKISESMSNATGSISSMMGSANNSLESMASLVSSFKQLHLSPNMVKQFIPVVTNYVRTNGGQVMANLLQSALTVP